MKKYMFCLAVALLAPMSQANASDVGFSVGINVGTPAPPVVVAEPPVFVAPPQLGFYVAVGMPYDMFYTGDHYYLHRGSAWYSSPYYNGPWSTVHYRKVPYGLRKHSFDRIHYYRDRYYQRYHRHGGPDYRHFRPQRHDWDRGGHGGGRYDHGRGGDGHGHRGR